MKTSRAARRVHQIQIWAGLALVLALALAEFGVALRYERACECGVSVGPAGELQGLDDWLGKR